MLRTIWIVFRDLVDEDSVRPFIILYYMPLLAFGIIAAIILPANFADALLFLWIWIQIPATVSAMVGLALRHGDVPIDEITDPPTFADWFGLILQIGGHACMVAVLTGFELVAWNTAINVVDVVEGPFGFFLRWLILFATAAISSYVIGCSLLAFQASRKLARIVSLHRQALR